MALTSTMHNITLELSDVDRGVYQTLELKLARHPSESAEYLVTRLLAYALEYTEGIEFTPGLSDGDDPPIVVRDLTGKLLAWIDVGSPDAARLHRAAKAVDRVAVYTHKDLRNVLGQLEGKKIHRAAEIPLFAFDRQVIEEIAERLQRRMQITLSRTEGHLYLDVDGHAIETVVGEHRVG
ncbi:MAG: YaeQ family protein [Thermoanaerobaculia bacterium]